MPCSRVTETGDFVTASSGAPRWKELSSSSPLIRFPDFSLLFLTSRFVAYEGFSPGERERLERSFGFLLPGEFEGFGFLFCLVEHSLRNKWVPVTSARRGLRI